MPLFRRKTIEKYNELLILSLYETAPSFGMNTFKIYQLKWSAIHACCNKKYHVGIQWVERSCLHEHLWIYTSESHRLILQILYLYLFSLLSNQQREALEPTHVRDILATIPFGTRLDRTLTWLIENHFDCLEAGYKDEYEYPTTVDIAIAKNIAKHSKLQNDPILFQRLLSNANNPDSTLQYASLYSLKHVIVLNPNLGSDDNIRQLMNDDPYDQMVLTGLFMHLTFRGVDVWERYQHLDVWNPCWNYNRTELCFLHAIRHFVQRTIPDASFEQITETWQWLNAIETQRLDLAERTSGRIQELVCKYWELLEHPELTKMVLTTLQRHKLGFEVLTLLIQHPCWEIGDQATGILCGMLPNDDTLLPTLSQLFEMADYATISICSQLCSLYQRPELLLFFGYKCATHTDAQIRGHYAQKLRLWTQRYIEDERLKNIENNLDIWRLLSQDDDLWCTHEVRTLCQNIKDIHANPFDWLELNSKNPILQHCPHHHELGYTEYMNAILEIQKRRIREGQVSLLSLPKHEFP